MVRQAFLLTLVCSLLFASSAAACACSHHVEKKAEKVDCHSQASDPEQVDTDENTCDQNCICGVNQLSTYLAPVDPNKKVKQFEELAKPERSFTETAFVALNGYIEPSPDFVNNVLFSSVFSSLPPSRAPPRV